MFENHFLLLCFRAKLKCKNLHLHVSETVQHIRLLKRNYITRDILI